ALGAKLRRSHFLFLGYTMADWNLRLLLHRLWGDQPLSYRSWAVQPEPMPIQREFWRRRDVDVLETHLEPHALARAPPGPMPIERDFWRRRDVDGLELPLERYVMALARQAGFELAEASA